ncbi:hypothetical protein Ciccas_011934 [Cichlidogyrus casuarinus]|uniref:BZIP domain-containing protein n=1 Tax=Cichlidogyrus casuarinus TaxID=1844966 RepID=A0ABD2PQI9_9PLAT
MESVLINTATPHLGHPLLGELSEDILFTLFSSPSISNEELDSFADLDLTPPTSSPNDSSNWNPDLDDLLDIVSASPNSSVCTEPQTSCDMSLVYLETSVGNGIKRRKCDHQCLPLDEDSMLTDLDWDKEAHKEKKVSNKEAAFRYRQKVKLRASKMQQQLDESFRSMNRAKHAYEKALESFFLLQRVVNDITS